MEALLWIKRNPMFANLNKRASLTSSTKSNDKKTILFKELQGVMEVKGVKTSPCQRIISSAELRKVGIKRQVFLRSYRELRS